MVAVLPTGLSSVPQPQLCGSPGRGVGRPDTGRGRPAELRAATPGTVPVLDLLLRLHLVRALRSLLERFRLQLARRATAPATVICLLEADETLYPLYSSISRGVTGRQDEPPHPSYYELHHGVIRVA